MRRSDTIIGESVASVTDAILDEPDNARENVNDDIELSDVVVYYYDELTRINNSDLINLYPHSGLEGSSPEERYNFLLTYAITFVIICFIAIVCLALILWFFWFGRQRSRGKMKDDIVERIQERYAERLSHVENSKSKRNKSTNAKRPATVPRQKHIVPRNIRTAKIKKYPTRLKTAVGKSTLKVNPVVGNIEKPPSDEGSQKSGRSDKVDAISPADQSPVQRNVENEEERNVQPRGPSTAMTVQVEINEPKVSQADTTEPKGKDKPFIAKKLTKFRSVGEKEKKKEEDLQAQSQEHFETITDHITTVSEFLEPSRVTVPSLELQPDFDKDHVAVQSSQ